MLSKLGPSENRNRDVPAMAVEQRKWPRKGVNADGFLYECDGWPIGPCRIEDVSVGGAKLTHAVGEKLPERLVLLLSRNGQVRRDCEVAWRDKDSVGVRFLGAARKVEQR